MSLLDEASATAQRTSRPLARHRSPAVAGHVMFMNPEATRNASQGTKSRRDMNRTHTLKFAIVMIRTPDAFSLRRASTASGHGVKVR